MSDATMPVFVIKAKDKLAVLAVEAYRRLCLDVGLDAQAEQVDLAISEMILWRNAHLDQVALPDHQHVSADGLLPAGLHCASCDGHSCDDVG